MAFSCPVMRRALSTCRSSTAPNLLRVGEQWLRPGSTVRHTVCRVWQAGGTCCLNEHREVAHLDDAEGATVRAATAPKGPYYGWSDQPGGARVVAVVRVSHGKTRKIAKRERYRQICATASAWDQVTAVRADKSLQPARPIADHNKLPGHGYTQARHWVP